MDTKAAPIDPARVAKLMQGLGICIHLYQQIEFHLKFLLPHMQIHGGEAQPQSGFNWRELLDSRNTLGQLVNTFKGRIQAEDPEAVGDYLRRLVEQRNDLVHHLVTDPSRPLHTAADFERAIDEVRQYMRFASPLLSGLRVATSHFAESLVLSDRDDFLLMEPGDNLPPK